MAVRRDEHAEPEDRSDWREHAACRDEHSALFFPPLQFERRELRLVRERVAKAVCVSCPVTDHCLEYAIVWREPHGVWGGMNEVERRRLVEMRSLDGPSDRLL